MIRFARRWAITCAWLILAGGYLIGVAVAQAMTP